MSHAEMTEIVEKLSEEIFLRSHDKIFKEIKEECSKNHNSIDVINMVIATLYTQSQKNCKELIIALIPYFMNPGGENENTEKI